MLNPTLPLHKHTLPSKLKHKMLNPILPLHKHTLLSKLKHIHHTSRHSKHSLNTDVQNGKHYSMNGKHFMNDQENYTFACSCCRLAFSPFVKYPNIKQQKCSKKENIILYLRPNSKLNGVQSKYILPQLLKHKTRVFCA